MPPIVYQGKALRLDPQLEQDTVKILKVLAERERDVFKVNTRSFRRFDLVKDHGIFLPQPRINAVFERLAEVGACTFKKGKSGMYEKATFEEPARIIARRLLGQPDEKAAKRLADPVAEKQSELMREILNNKEMSAESKISMLKVLLNKG